MQTNNPWRQMEKPHSATLTKPNRKLSATPERLPHSATVAQPREALPSASAAGPPHPATATRSKPGLSFARVQRREHTTSAQCRPLHPAGSPTLQSRPCFGAAQLAKLQEGIEKGKVQPTIVKGVAIQGTKEFTGFVLTLLQEIEKVNIGKFLLEVFEEGTTNGHFSTATSGGAPVTVAIVERTDIHSWQPIRTGGFDSWDKSYNVSFGNKTVPLVQLPGPDTEFKQAKLVVTKQGVLQGHVDFPGGTPMAVVLFHELCHAYYWQTGATKTLQAVEPRYWPKEWANRYGLNASEHTEEQMVSGLVHGKGMRFCENRYRLEAKLPLRSSYLAASVDIRDPEVGNMVLWDLPPKATIGSVLKANGFLEVCESLSSDVQNA